MTNKSLVTMLTVAVLSLSTVNAFAAEAGVLGLKPSANQGSNSSTGTTTNKEVPSDIQYDTGKYQYPAQQLIAEGRQFDKYNWRLYQRFADGEFDYKAWASDLGYTAEDYSNNNFEILPNGLEKHYFDFSLKSDQNFNGLNVWDDGLKTYAHENRIRFRKYVNDQKIMDGIARVPALSTCVSFEPNGCWQELEDIVTPAYRTSTNWQRPGQYVESWWRKIFLDRDISQEGRDFWNANFTKPCDPTKIYYPEKPDVSMYVSGLNLDRIAKHMAIIDTVYTDNSANNIDERGAMIKNVYDQMEGFEKTN